MHGELGDDYITGGSDDAATDIAYGGDGDDEIDVADTPAAKDYVYCGLGNDEVSADSLDVIASDCEIVEHVEVDAPTADLTTATTDEEAQPLSGESNTSVQAQGFNCWVQAQNPHESSNHPQVAAKGRTWCMNNQYSVYTRTELYRFRWSGWRFLDVDKNTQYYWWESRTNTRWGCAYKISTTYRNYTYGRVRNNGNWADGYDINDSNRKLFC